MTQFNKFKNKVVIVTGHTGFKGVWLSQWLLTLGAEVIGIALDPIDEPSHFTTIGIAKNIKDYRVDIRDQNSLERLITNVEPDFVFHLAAQALVRKSYEDSIETWQTNVLGTVNLLQALRKLDKRCAAVLITSDKCYDNVEWVWGYRETDAMGGPDPYSASKGAAELAIKSHIKSFFPKDSSLVRISSARAGNVIGGGDWSSDRIIPDCVKAWSRNEKVKLRNPNATRPWQHVLEPLSGYLCQAIALYEDPFFHGESFNFGPSSNQNHTVMELVERMAIYWNQVRWEDVSSSEIGPYESGLLKLNCDKALHYLNWRAVMDFQDTIRMTAEWYKSFYQDKANMAEITKSQITEYVSLADSAGLLWAK